MRPLNQVIGYSEAQGGGGSGEARLELATTCDMLGSAMPADGDAALRQTKQLLINI